jgi:hypothetical protein
MHQGQDFLSSPCSPESPLYVSAEKTIFDGTKLSMVAVRARTTTYGMVRPPSRSSIIQIPAGRELILAPDTCSFDLFGRTSGFDKMNHRPRFLVFAALGYNVPTRLFSRGLFIDAI